MGWRSQAYELTKERDFNGLPGRDRKIIQRAGWVAALTIMFACIVAGQQAYFEFAPNRSYTAVSNVRK